MKLASQADYLIQKFGAEESLLRLKTTGYESIVFQIDGRYDEPFTQSWTENDLEQYFQPINTAANQLQMNIPFTILGTAIYNDYSSNTTSARIKMAKQAIKATYYMGSKVMALRPVFFYCKNDYTLSKQLTYDFMKILKEEAEQHKIQLAFLNNANCYAYGARAEELIELADYFDARIVIDPSIAFYSGARVEELLEKCGKHVIGFLVTDTKNRLEEPAFPTQGSLKYEIIKRELEKCNSNAFITMMYSPILKRYADFMKHNGVVDAVDKFLYKLGNCLNESEESI